ncbi:hypothetical protein A4A49_13582 [Nicotiana attenuata]|uniref:Uncharacterized protein n=1 Tax=Nicotiana attenuata TaxID=49451 RepID=A0A1J6JAQ3_NICAT|nr:hypothetical protein A4A49_13582 [Nicotiana attenuata]
MFGIGSNGAKKHLFSIKLQLYYSTAPPDSHANVLVDFPVNLLGFSSKDAISTSGKIKTLVSSSPDLLLRRVDNDLKPKIKVLQEFGLSGSDLVTLVKKTNFLKRGLHTTIKPNLDYLWDLLGSLDSVVRIVKKEPRLLTNNLLKLIPPNLSLLQNLGFPWADVEMAFHRHPRYLLNKPEQIERAVHQLERNFHVPRESRMFLHGIEALASVFDESIVEKKLDIFQSFGWSDSDICEMVRRHPYCLNSSEAKIRSTLKFFMMELGYESSYLAFRPTLLVSSLEKRVMPRNEILKFLKENQLVTEKLSLYTVVMCSESKFLENYVLPFRPRCPKCMNYT